MMPYAARTRFGASLLIAASAAALTPAQASEAILASPEQDAAETLALELAAHPDVAAIKTGLRAQLLATPIGQTRDGAATTERAIDCMTLSLIFKEISATRAIPFFVWGTEDTPRQWRGRTTPCAGTAGDNPDNIYRSTVIDGGVRYEVTGRLDPARRATQLIFQAGTSEPGIAPNLATAGSEAVQVLSALSDRDLKIGPDGAFRMTLGGGAGAEPHVATPPGRISIGFRDTMADWNQRPAQLAIRRIDPGESKTYDRDELRQRVVGRLGDYVRGWSQFATYGFGGLQPNTHAKPTGRAGGWGFVMGLRFALADDEALAVTITRGGAEYLGFQVTDPWTIAGDARAALTSLNLAQSTPDKDGAFTYVIARSDPGVANWLDTGGLHDGFGVVRWQKTPDGAAGDGLLRSFRIIKVADAASLPGIAKITPKQRAAQLAKRAREWANRLQ